MAIKYNQFSNTFFITIIVAIILNVVVKESSNGILASVYVDSIKPKTNEISNPKNYNKTMMF